MRAFLLISHLTITGRHVTNHSAPNSLDVRHKSHNIPWYQYSYHKALPIWVLGKVCTLVVLSKDARAWTFLSPIRDDRHTLE